MTPSDPCMKMCADDEPASGHKANSSSAVQPEIWRGTHSFIIVTCGTTGTRGKRDSMLLTGGHDIPQWIDTGVQFSAASGIKSTQNRLDLPANGVDMVEQYWTGSGKPRGVRRHWDRLQKRYRSGELRRLLLSLPASTLPNRS